MAADDEDVRFPRVTARDREFEAAIAHMKEMVAEVAKRETMGQDAIWPTRHMLVKIFDRLIWLEEQIDLAFGARAFDRRFHLMSPMNLRRIEFYIRAHARVQRLIYRAIRIWCLTAGVYACTSPNCGARRQRRRRRPRSTGKKK